MIYLQVLGRGEGSLAGGWEARERSALTSILLIRSFLSNSSRGSVAFLQINEVDFWCGFPGSIRLSV